MKHELKLRPVTLIESPYSNGGSMPDNEKFIMYAQECCLHSINNGESPYASHLLHTQYLKDDEPVERSIGINCGQSLAPLAKTIAFYVDHGFSSGMVDTLITYMRYESYHQKILFRSIKGDLGTLNALADIKSRMIYHHDNNTEMEKYLKEIEELFKNFRIS